MPVLDARIGFSGFQASPEKRSIWAGLPKGYIWPFETLLFPSKLKGNHHLQCNVQVYNVRIPVGLGQIGPQDLVFASIYQGSIFGMHFRPTAIWVWVKIQSSGMGPQLFFVHLGCLLLATASSALGRAGRPFQQQPSLAGFPEG